jgi:hypothetical protein
VSIDAQSSRSLDGLTGLLYEFCRHEGLTEKRVKKHPVILNLCDPLNRRPEAAVKFIVSVVREMQDYQAGRALFSAYALNDDADPSEEQRREHFATSEQISLSLIIELENKAIDELALRLLNGHHQASPDGSQVVNHGRYLAARLAETCLIKNRRVTEVYQRRTVIALNDESGLFASDLRPSADRYARGTSHPRIGRQLRRSDVD